MSIRMLAVLHCCFLLIVASTLTRIVLAETPTCGDKNKQPVQYISLFGSCPAFEISCSTAHSETVLMHFACQGYIQDSCWLLSRQPCVIGSQQAMPNMYNPVLGPSVTELDKATVFEGIDINVSHALDEMTNVSPKDTQVKIRKHGLFLLKATRIHFNATLIFTHVSAVFKGVSLSSDGFTPRLIIYCTADHDPTKTAITTSTYVRAVDSIEVVPCTIITPPITTPPIATTETATTTYVRAVDNIEVVPFGGDSNHSYRRSWQFHYNLTIPLTVVLLVTSLVVFSFLRFKQSNKRRSTIDLELQELVIKDQTFATSDNIDSHNTESDHEKEKSQVATTSKTHKQIEAKLPDIINSRD